MLDILKSVNGGGFSEKLVCIRFVSAIYYFAAVLSLLGAYFVACLVELQK